MDELFISPVCKKYSEVDFKRIVLTPSVSLYHKRVRFGRFFWIVLSFESMGGYAPKALPILFKGSIVL